jgi:coproporphyrinogen III oxidase
MQDNTRKIFTKGKTLLWLEHALYAESSLALGKVKFSYGMIPTPKYDTNQKNYYTGMGNPWSLYGIYIDHDTRGDKQATMSMFTAVLECYASEAYRLTTPDIFEVKMSLKYAESKDETDMFEYVRSGIVFDLGKIFSAVTSNLPEQASNAIVDHTSWSSKYKSFLPKAEEQLAKIVADFRQEQSSK